MVLVAYENEPFTLKVEIKFRFKYYECVCAV